MKLFFNIFVCSLLFASNADLNLDKSLYKRQDLESERIDKAKEIPNGLKQSILENDDFPVLILGATPFEKSVLDERPNLLKNSLIEFYDQSCSNDQSRTDRFWGLSIKGEFKDFPHNDQINRYGSIIFDWGVFYFFLSAKDQAHESAYESLFKSLKDGGVLFISSFDTGGSFQSQHAYSIDINNPIYIAALQGDPEYADPLEDNRERIIYKRIKERYFNFEKNSLNLPKLFVKGIDPKNLNLDMDLINNVEKRLEIEFLVQKLAEVGFDIQIVDANSVSVGHFSAALKTRQPIPKKVMIAVKPKKQNKELDLQKQLEEDRRMAMAFQEEEEKIQRQIEKDAALARILAND